MKIQAYSLFGISGLFGVMALVLAIIGLASETSACVPIMLPMLLASLIGTNAASALITLERRVSELERKAASTDQEPSKK